MNQGDIQKAVKIEYQEKVAWAKERLEECTRLSREAELLVWKEQMIYGFMMQNSKHEVSKLNGQIERLQSFLNKTE